MVCIIRYGKLDVEKMQLITYDPVHHDYIALEQRVGNAFADGKQLKWDGESAWQEEGKALWLKQNIKRKKKIT